MVFQTEAGGWNVIKESLYRGDEPWAINELLGEQSFSLKDVDFSQVERINDLVAIFIEFEEDSILFYEMLHPFIQDEDTLVQLDKIIAEENLHIERLREFIEGEVPVTESRD